MGSAETSARSGSPAIVWFRQDLRLDDNPALAAAVGSGRPLLPVFVLDDETPGEWVIGAASRWWLHHSLAALDGSLATLGLSLCLRRGRADDQLDQLVAETSAGAVFWNRCYDPFSIARDTAIKRAFAARDVEAHSFNGALLHEPWTVAGKQGQPLKVFSAFWRACRAQGKPADPVAAPSSAHGFPGTVASDPLESWGLRPTAPDWAGGLRDTWTPGERGAIDRLDRFLAEGLAGYGQGRDLPGTEKVSRLSPHLHWGEISPRRVWQRVEDARAAATAPDDDIDKFLAELGWREFSHSLLYHFPELPRANLDRRFDAFGWVDDDEAFRRWTRGTTGYPIVDAGMRQLWQTGWMHNRVRMITASFLIKHLLIDWRWGERWFWDTLVDADLPANSASWQWVAGCGADAAPYFRIFNPTLQGEKFDPDGAYVRRFVPELAELPAKYLHKPWTAPRLVLDQAGIKLGTTYPEPIVDHKWARERALEAFAQVKKGDD